MFFRLFVLINLLALNLLACKNGYFSCIAKIKDSQTIQKDSLSIPIQGDKRLVYSKHTPNAKILKKDPFLNLYIIKDKKHFKYPFDINMRLQLGTAAVTDKTFQEGKVLKQQVGLNSLGRYSAKIKTPALIVSSCCALEGLLTPDGLIDKYYLKHFINSKSGRYGDIGIRVQDQGRCVKIIASNPYLKYNPLKRGDCVLAFDGKKIYSAAQLMKKILFSKVGSKHTIKIKRDGKVHSYKVTVKTRTGGGEISDTFLELKGIFFNKKLEIVKVNQEFQEYGLKLGDKLIQVNGVSIENQNELREYIENFKDFSSLLFERKNFQFFVNIK
ncbi:MAG: PDZ domain-containing protein [Sulfurimonas sp.]